MKTLIILSAIPASGKSTWANKYQATHENTFIVSSDQIRMEITGSFNDHTRQAEVWEEFSKRIHEFGRIENVTVILDALNDLNSLRVKYVTENPEFDKYILVYFPVNLDKSLYLNSLRLKNMQVPSEILKTLAQKYEEPSEEVIALFDEVQKVEW